MGCYYVGGRDGRVFWCVEILHPIDKHHLYYTEDSVFFSFLSLPSSHLPFFFDGRGALKRGKEKKCGSQVE